MHICDRLKASMTQVIKNRVYLLYENCVGKFIANYVPSQKQAGTNPRSSHSNTQYFEAEPQQFKKWTLVLKTIVKAMFFSSLILPLLLWERRDTS